MQVQELYSLANWFVSAAEKTKLINVFKDGSTNLKRTSENILAGNFTQEKSKLHTRIETSLQAFDYSLLTSAQKLVLEELNLSALFSEKSHEHLNSLLSGITDNVFVTSSLQAHYENLSTAYKAFKAISDYVPVVAKDETLPPSYLESEKVLTRITFKDKANIGNVTEFKDWGEQWFNIARGFAMSQNTSPESFEIVNAQRGSVIIDMLLNPELVTVIAETIKSLADAVTSLAEMYAALKAIEALKDTVDKNHYNVFVQDAEKNIEIRKEEITEKVLQDLKAKGLLKVDNADNEIKKSIKTLASFQESGGELRCLTKSVNENETNLDAIESLNESVKLLKNKSTLKLLENKEEPERKDTEADD